MQPLQNCNVPTILIGQEILCLMYVDFLCFFCLLYAFFVPKSTLSIIKNNPNAFLVVNTFLSNFMHILG